MPASLCSLTPPWGRRPALRLQRAEAFAHICTHPRNALLYLLHVCEQAYTPPTDIHTHARTHTQTLKPKAQSLKPKR